MTQIQNYRMKFSSYPLRWISSQMSTIASFPVELGCCKRDCFQDVSFTSQLLAYIGKAPAILGPEQKMAPLSSDEHILSRPLIPRLPLQAEESPLMWFDIIERYTACGLTKPEDKLIAISGLAKHFQQCTGVGYCTGIWLDHLHTGLLWAAKKRMQQVQGSRASSWSWAALEELVAFPISIAHHEYGRELPEMTSEVALLLAVQDAPTENEELAWLNGPASLAPNVCLRHCMLSTVAMNGRFAQRVPFVSRVGDFESGERLSRRIEPYADVARRLGMGTLQGTKEESEFLRSHGYQMLSVIEDPQMNEDTMVRYIVDESGNAVGWAALDEEDSDPFVRPAPEPGSAFEVFQMHSCIKVASYTDQLGVKSSFGLILKPKPQGRPGEWVRIGMGFVRGDAYFEEVSQRFIFLA